MYLSGTASVETGGTVSKVPGLPVAAWSELSHCKAISLEFDSLRKWKRNWKRLSFLHQDGSPGRNHLQVLDRDPNAILALVLSTSGFSAWLLSFPFNSVSTPSPPPHSLLINSPYKRLISQSLFLLQAVNASYWFLPSFSVYWHYLSTFTSGTKHRTAAWSVTLENKKFYFLKLSPFPFMISISVLKPTSFLTSQIWLCLTLITLGKTMALSTHWLLGKRRRGNVAKTGHSPKQTIKRHNRAWTP